MPSEPVPAAVGQMIPLPRRCSAATDSRLFSRAAFTSAGSSVTATTAPAGDPDPAVFLRELGRRVRLLRLTQEWTQDELARKADISRSFVSLIERGAHGVDVVRLLRLAAVFDMPLTRLLDIPTTQERTCHRPNP